MGQLSGEQQVTDDQLGLSVVIPVYNEEGSVPELHKQLTKVLDKLKSKYEVIYVDDGSTDSSLEKIKKLKNAKYLSLRRNVGNRSF